MPNPGDIIAGCRILAESGRGAYGHVYLAEDMLGRRVAVKLLLTPEGGNYELKGLRSYISMAAPHPALLQVFFCGVENGVPYYVMEAADDASGGDGPYVADTLALRLNRRGRLPADEALALCRTILEGLGAMHAARLLHRDVKPENVIFVNGCPKLADPGLSRRFTQTLSVAGTPGYIPPEFLEGRVEATPVSDIYACGKLLYRIVTGNPPERYPFMPEDMAAADLYQLCRPLAKMCNRDPARRYANCAECLKALPQNLRQHGAVRRFRDELLMRPAFRRRILLRAAWVALALLLAVSALWGLGALRTRRRAALAQRKAQVQQELDAFRRTMVQLTLQLDGTGHEDALPTAEALQSQEALIAADHPEEVTEWLSVMRERLTSLAVELAPTAENWPQEPAAATAACGEGFGYLASPLGSAFLPEERRAALRARLEAEATELANCGSLRLGASYTEGIHGNFVMAFVPPGRFRSPLDGQCRVVPYPYWIFPAEVPVDLYNYATHTLPSRPPQTTSVEYVSWNGALLFCRHLTRMLFSHNVLPPGYVIRPPMEAEWEFAAVGGWAGEAPVSEEMAARKSSRQELKTTNALGLLQMDDNLAELVEPYADVPAGYPGAAVVRGAWYNYPQTGITFRRVYVRDQTFMAGASGLRPVLAPAPEDYFDKAWFRGTEICHGVVDGAVYVGWLTSHAATSGVEVAALAQNMGATLPETTSPAEIGRIFRALGLPEGFPCALGIQYTEGQWRRLSDGAAVEVAGVKAPSGTLNWLCANDSETMVVRDSFGTPVVLLRWPTEEAFRQRRGKWLKQAQLAAFEVDGRSFVVCRAAMTSNVVRSFAHFMGVRQPVLSSPDFTARLMAHLPPRMCVALGPIRFYEGWEQSDGTPLPGTFVVGEGHTATEYASPTEDILTAYEGRLAGENYADAILIEL